MPSCPSVPPQPAACPAHPASRSLAYYHLEEFESALDAFQAAADLEPTKMIHKSWLNMCRVQLGGEASVMGQRCFFCHCVCMGKAWA